VETDFSKIRLGIPTLCGNNWMGGINYINNLIGALSTLPTKERPQIHFIINEKHLSALPLHREILSVCDKLIYLSPNPGPVQTLFGDSLLYVRSEQELFKLIDVYFPDNFDKMQNINSIKWIPDLQHHFLPEFFTPEEIVKRNAVFKKAADSKGTIVFSSESAKNDFSSGYPHSTARLHVLHFFSRTEERWFEDNPDKIAAKYNLPEKFLINCNQFWKHKDHLTLLQAISQLKQEGIPIPLVCTGPTDDYRFRDYMKTVADTIRTLGINDLVHILGILPRQEQIQLIRKSSAMIQPSLFEGWSTVVEDAKALGKTILLSDISVHQEQKPDYAHFFKKQDVAGLKNLLRQIWPALVPGPDSTAENKAKEETATSVARFAAECMSMIKTHLSPLKKDAPMPVAVNEECLRKEKEFWNAGTIEEAMFEKIVTDKRILSLPKEQRIEEWNKSVQSSINQILKGLPCKPDWKVLEIGCAIGRLVKPLRQQFAQVDGVDIAETMISFSRQYMADARPNGRIVLNNGADLMGFPDATYDLVYSMITFQHIRSASVVKSYFSEISRVLKPGGFFRLQVFDRSNPKMGDMNDEAENDRQYGFFGNGYTPEQLRALFDGFGFAVQDLTHTSPWIWATGQKKAAVLDNTIRFPEPLMQDPGAFLSDVTRLVEQQQFKEAVDKFTAERNRYYDSPELKEFEALIQKLKTMIK